MKVRQLKLPLNLRSELKTPLGILIKGSPDLTTPILIDKLSKVNGTVISVGDVCSSLLIESGFFPDLIITDGYTKRVKLDLHKDFDEYKPINAACPPGEISIEAWNTIRKIVKDLENTTNKFQLKIDGEEDLLVLTVIYEFPIESAVIYGQPNEGVVLRIIDSKAKNRVESLILKM